MSMMTNAKGIDHYQNSALGEGVNARGFNTAWSYRLLTLIDGRATTMPSGGLASNVSAPVVKGDIQDIEIITGPGSALYGPDAISGIVSIATKDPRHAQGTRVSLAGGERSTLKSGLYHARQRGQWAWKITGDYHRTRDYELTNTFYNADSTFSVTDSPDFDVSAVRAGVGLYYYPNDESRWALTTGGTRVNHLGTSNLGRFQSDGMMYHYQQLTYTSPKWHLNLYHNGDDLGDFHLLESKAGNMLAGQSEAEAKENAAGGAGSQSSMWEVEGRYNFSLSQLQNTRLVIGANFRQARGSEPDEEEMLDLDDAQGQIIVSQAGLYGQSETDLSHQLRLVLAARVDEHEVYDPQFSPRAALIYKPRPEWAVRASFNRAFLSPHLIHQHIFARVTDVVVARGNSQGFRFANLNGDPLPPEYAAGIPTIRPEKSNTFEVGFKGVLDKRVFLDVSGYRSRYEDFISPLRIINDIAQGIVIIDKEGNPRQEVTFSYINFGKQTVQGLDMGVNAYLDKRIEARGSISLIDAKKLETTRDIDQPFNTPSAIYNLGLTATDAVGPGTNLDLALKHVTEFDFGAGVHVGTVPSYTVVDLSLGYRAKHGLVYRLSIDNLLDNKHREFVTGPELGRMAVTEVEFAL